MAFPIWIQLIGVVIVVCAIGTVVGVILVCPVIELCFGVGLAGYFSHGFLLSEPKSPRTLLCAWQRWSKIRFTRTKTKPTKELSFSARFCGVKQ